MAEKTTTKKTVVFLHPDLGIGGAERLVVDAAVGLQNRGHKVVVFTSHCDPNHCFDEARDGTLDVRVRGNTLVPSNILGRFSILCAILRQLHLILQMHLSGELAALEPDAFFVDQLSAGLPLLQYLAPRRSPIFFYCHFPDLLLVQGRKKWYKRVYRLPFDALEQWSMSFADAVAVNSSFTRGVVASTWPRLARQKELKVVYPCIDLRPATPATGPEKKQKGATAGDEGGLDMSGPIWKGKKVVLSINRFERKKDIALAIKAYAGLSRKQRTAVRLVIAGGYDNRVAENVSYHKDLETLASSLGLRAATARTIVTALNVPDDVEVLFLLSVPATLKALLLRSATLLVYTPTNEHFGIVPLEAMLAGVPVLATNTGGPVETVVEGETGWLRAPERVAEWTAVMDRVLNGMTGEERARMSEAGVRRVRENFGDAQMAACIEGILAEAENPPRSPLGAVVAVCILGVLAVVGAVAAKVGSGFFR